MSAQLLLLNGMIEEYEGMLSFIVQVAADCPGSDTTRRREARLPELDPACPSPFMTYVSLLDGDTPEETGTESITLSWTGEVDRDEFVTEIGNVPRRLPERLRFKKSSAKRLSVLFVTAQRCLREALADPEPQRILRTDVTNKDESIVLMVWPRLDSWLSNELPTSVPVLRAPDLWLLGNDDDTSRRLFLSGLVPGSYLNADSRLSGFKRLFEPREKQLLFVEVKESGNVKEESARSSGGVGATMK